MPLPVPEVERGDLVFWYPDGQPGEKPYVALVTAVGQETIAVNIFDSQLRNMQCKDGVRHLSDPKARQNEFREQGGWDHLPQTKWHKKIHQAMADKIIALEATLNDLTAPPACTPSQSKKESGK